MSATQGLPTDDPLRPMTWQAYRQALCRLGPSLAGPDQSQASGSGAAALAAQQHQQLGEADIDTLMAMLSQRREAARQLLLEVEREGQEEAASSSSSSSAAAAGSQARLQQARAFRAQVERDCEQLERWLVALLSWRSAHRIMLRRHLDRIGLREVEMRLRMQMDHKEFSESKVGGQEGWSEGHQAPVGRRRF